MISVEHTQFNSKNNRIIDASILRALGHPIRLKILMMLDMREYNVKYIWKCLGMEQAVVSQHLTVLKDRGIINGERRGTEMHYTIVNPLAQKIVDEITRN